MTLELIYCDLGLMMVLYAITVLTAGRRLLTKSPALLTPCTAETYERKI